MISVLGKRGRILQVYADGDIRVNVNGQSFTFNPRFCIPLTSSSSTAPTTNSTSFLNSTSHNTLQAYQVQQQMECASRLSSGS